MSKPHGLAVGATGALATAAARLLRSRRLVRAPIWIYKARAGAVFGSRLLMLEHIGRKSGARRYVVLEVVDHPTPDTYVAASGFGTKAQWFRNVQANPKVRLYSGSHTPAAATARVLDPLEADRVLAAYSSRHRRVWARFKQVLEATLGSPINDTNTQLPMVELRLGGQARS
jgi:deazaflavin-dependent oxidoreductase (nitroreductase family)